MMRYTKNTYPPYLMGVQMNQHNPIEQIREKERAAKQRQMAAERVAETILHRAREEARKLHAEAVDRGRNAGQKAVERGMADAQKEANERIAVAKEQIAVMATQSEALLQQSVEWALSLLLPGESGGADA